MSTTTERPTTTGEVEQRALTAESGPIQVTGRRLHGVVPFGVESRDMGGWTEVLEPGCLDGADLSDLIATVDHAGVPLARHPSTLTVDHGTDGMRWSLELPESRSDVREAVERGDLRAGSWRMVVKRDEFRGDVRHIHEIASLRDVAVVSAPAYPEARCEYRSAPDPTVPASAPTTHPEKEATVPEAITEAPAVEDRTAPTTTTGGLQVEDRAASTRPAPRSLSGAFRENGFPGETATVEFGEFRAATFAGTVANLAPVAQVGVDLGQDQRYAWPIFQQVSVDAGATSVQVLQQTSRSLPATASMIRNIDAVTAKPEVSSVLDIATTALKQVAAIQTNIPNVYLEQPAFNSVIENDLRLALNEALDKLVLDAVGASGFQAPGTDKLLVSIRKAITVLQASGYSPDVVILTPANSEALDTLRIGATASSEDYVFSAGGLAPTSLFGLQVRVSKTATAPVVADSRALGKLYVSPIALARFEVDAGATNRSNVRLEGHGVFGVERQDAARRIAAS